MRTTRSTVTFRTAFTLNKDLGELPAGTYDVEFEEEEIPGSERTGYRRTALYFYVEAPGSTRTLVVDPSDLEAALRRDAGKRAGSTGSEGVATGPPNRSSP